MDMIEKRNLSSHIKHLLAQPHLLAGREDRRLIETANRKVGGLERRLVRFLPLVEPGGARNAQDIALAVRRGGDQHGAGLGAFAVDKGHQDKMDITRSDRVLGSAHGLGVGQSGSGGVLRHSAARYLLVPMPLVAPKDEMFRNEVIKFLLQAVGRKVLSSLKWKISRTAGGKNKTVLRTEPIWPTGLMSSARTPPAPIPAQGALRPVDDALLVIHRASCFTFKNRSTSGLIR